MERAEIVKNWAAEKLPREYDPLGFALADLVQRLTAEDARDETIRQLHERLDEQNRIHLEIYHQCDRELTAAGIPNLAVGSDEPHCFTSKRIAALAAKVKDAT